MNTRSRRVVIGGYDLERILLPCDFQGGDPRNYMSALSVWLFNQSFLFLVYYKKSRWDYS
ncbi:protein of unknown function [Serratia sp. Tan611]|nr:protein of unknown function [Serratia sp. Tan611]